MPNATREEVTQHENYNLMVACHYQELAEADPAASEPLYQRLQRLSVSADAARAERAGYTVTLLSDGTASYNEFNGAFSVRASLRGLRA
ncbi:MAG: hypothetical protein ACLRSW_12780 [Christensenellaceae bacterium]